MARATLMAMDQRRRTRLPLDRQVNGEVDGGGSRLRGRRAHATAWLVGTVLLAASGCSGSEPPAATTAGDRGEQIVTTTTEPSSFCRALGQLATLRAEPTDDETARSERIATIYESLLDEVPDWMRPDFVFVIATLRGQAPPATDPPLTDDGGSATFDGEGYLTDATPAERVGNYINFACTGVENNPGPAPTDPP